VASHRPENKNGQTIMRKSIFGVLLMVLCVSAVPLARAQEKPQQEKPQQESLPASIEKRLQSFDPAAVAAARHYYGSPVLKASLAAIIPRITQGLAVAIEKANPELDAASKQEALAAVQEAVSSKLDLITDMSMIAALEVLTKDELVAVDQFYSSPVGQSVVTKLPQVMSRLPTMMQVVMPLVIEDLRAKMKAKGKDLRL
jgi:hypothetical protein